MRESIKMVIICTVFSLLQNSSFKFVYFNNNI